MARVFARYYVHLASIGSLPECEQVFLVAKEKIQNLYKDEQIEGYNLVIVKSETEVESDIIWCDYEEFTSGRFPFVCSILQPFENNPIDIDAEMAEAGFSRCADV